MAADPIFYLRESPTYTSKQVYPENLPQLMKAKDTSNDTFNCVLKATTRKKPYKPMSILTIEWVEQTPEYEEYYFLIHDSVSVASLNPVAYKHTLTVVQYRYFLNKHMIRNNVFNQPRQQRNELFASVSCTLNQFGYGADMFYDYRSLPAAADNRPDYWTDSLILNYHTRVKNFKYYFKLFGIGNSYYTEGGADKMVEILDFDDVHYDCRISSENPKFILIDQNNSDYAIIDGIPLNEIYQHKVFNDPQIVAQINQYLESRGVNNVKLAFSYFPTGLGTTYPQVTSSFMRLRSQSGDPQTGTKYMHFTLQLFVEIETYNFTMYDVINELLEQYKIRWTKGSELKDKNKQLFVLPESGELYDLLKSTYPPDTLRFTQATWYEALEEIFRFFDAGFKFKLNGNNDMELEIEYYNQYEKEITPRTTGISMEHSDKDFNNKRVTYYQNAIVPMEQKRVCTRCITLGIPGQNDYGIILDKPIFNLTKFEMQVRGSFKVDTRGWSSNSFTSDRMFLDVTRQIVSQEIWTNLSLANQPSDHYELIQKTTIPFERGSNFICLSSYLKTTAGTTVKPLDGIRNTAFNRFFGYGSSYLDTSSDIVVWSLPQATKWLDQMYNIKYDSLVSGRTTFETLEYQYPGEILTNQSNGGVDLNKLGLSIFGTTLKEGQPTLIANCEITKWEYRPVEGDYIVDEDGNKWVANVINYRLLPNGNQQCSIEFTRHFNALAMRVASDRAKRLTAISNDLASICEENFIDYIYVFDKSYYHNPTEPLGNNVAISNDAILSLVSYTFTTAQDFESGIFVKSSMKTWDQVWLDTDFQEWNGLVNIDISGITRNDIIEYEVHFYDPDDPDEESPYVNSYSASVSNYGDGVRFNIVSLLPYYPQGDDVLVQVWYKVRLKASDIKKIDVVGVTSYAQKGNNMRTLAQDVYIPVIKYGMGNSICFEMQYSNPMSAGNELIERATAWWTGGTGYFSKSVLYTDDEGWADTFDIDFYDFTSYIDLSDKTMIPKITKVGFIDSYGIGVAPLVESLGQIHYLRYYKKPNEIFALNYQWCFLPIQKEMNKFFIANKFINENIITTPEKINGKVFKLVYVGINDNDDFQYDILDIKGYNLHEKEVSFGFNASGNRVYMYILSDTQIDAKVWAIVDEQNDIYFASNNKARFTSNVDTTTTINFITRNNRIVE